LEREREWERERERRRKEVGGREGEAVVSKFFSK
jgi:hypothetical protein